MFAYPFRKTRHYIPALARRWLRDRKGTAAIEFAFLVMPMLTMYFGIVQVGIGLMIQRKVIQLNRAIADISSQYQTISDEDMQNIFSAAQLIMSPYGSPPAKIMVASIVVDPSGAAKVCWSSATGGATQLAPGAFTLPAELRMPNTSVILARSSYDYTPAIGTVITGTIEIGSGDTYMRPRAGTGSIEQVGRGPTVCGSGSGGGGSGAPF